MRTVLLCLLIVASLSVGAQRHCATADYSVTQHKLDPSLSLRTSAIEAFINNTELSSRTSSVSSSSSSAGIQPVIRIPVVIHVLYNNAAQNISDAQIKSGLDALNRDFRRKNADSVNTPARFKALAADVEIEFVLATADARGRGTTGIVRKQTNVTEWKMDDNIKYSGKGGDDAWDSDSYLNIWIGNMRSLLGYASAPGSTKDKDGVVISTNAFGTLNMGGPYNMGRTVVHEVGHWLGLRHIWGDKYCGDDAVADTPPQGNFTTGCPTGFRTSCSNGSTGDMYMNYMDFTDDACMNLFTEGQKARMRALFENGGPRASLKSSRGLNQPWLAEAPIKEEIKTGSAKISFYPNPVLTQLTMEFGTNDAWIGKEINVLSVNGTLLKQVTVTGRTLTINTSSLARGIYILNGIAEGQILNQKFIKH